MSAASCSERPDLSSPCAHRKAWWGREGDLVATSVTPLIARVDSADLAG